MTPATRLPNFFIGGAPNTGTTSLYFYLRQHPQVFMSPVKEPTFFGAAEYIAERPDDGARPVARRRSALRTFLRRAPKTYSWQDYLTLFRGVRNEIAVGEASPRTSSCRPPRGRCDRGYRMRPSSSCCAIRRSGCTPATWRASRDILGTLSRNGSARRWIRATGGRRPLQRFLDVFPRERLQIHLYEDFRSDPGAVVRDILAFLGVDPEYPIDVSYRHNPTVVPRSPGFETFLRWALRGLPVIQWLPPGVRRALRSLYYRRRPPLVMDPADRALVIDHYRDEILRTSELIGRDLSAWLR